LAISFKLIEAYRMVLRMVFVFVLLLGAKALSGLAGVKTRQNRSVSSAEGEQTNEPSGL
jgi:hypothetical protein